MATTTIERRGFRKGLSNVKLGRVGIVVGKICAVLGTKNRVSYNDRRRGIILLSPAEADAVEGIFIDEGVLGDQIWDK